MPLHTRTASQLSRKMRSSSRYQVDELEDRRMLAQLTATVAEQLAREVAYRAWNIGAAVTFQGGNLPYVVSQKWINAKTGLQAYGLTSNDNGPVLVLRGSEFFSNQFQYKDVLSDANPKGVGYDQFAGDWNGVRAWMKAQNASMDFVGHSLGGALAQWFAAAWSNEPNPGAGAGNFPVDQVFTFCSPGISDSRAINPFLLTYASGAGGFFTEPGFDPTRAKHVEHHIALGDIVSMGGEKFIAGSVITYSWADPNLINKHIRPFLNANVSPTPADLIGTPAPAPVVGALPIATLNAGNYVHNDADYRAFVATIQIVINAVSVVIPKAAPLRLVPVVLMRRDLCEASRKALGAVLNYVTGQFNLTKVNDIWTIQLGGQTDGLFKAALFEIDPSVTLTIDNTNNQNSLVVTGKMRIKFTLPNVLNVNLPGFLGGPINGSSLLVLSTLDVNGRIDKDKMSVGGNFNMMANLASVNGTITFNWTKGQVVVGGTSSFMGGFVTTGGNVIVNPDLSVTSRGAATVTMPGNLPLVGGKVLGTGTYNFKFDPNNVAGSFMEGIGTTTFWGFNVRAGALVTLAPSVTVICGNRRVRVLRPAPEPPTRSPQAENASGYAGYDIPTGQQWLVLDAAWPNPTAVPQMELIDPDGISINESVIASDSEIELFDVYNDSKSRAVIIHNPKPGLWQVRMLNDLSLGTVDYNAFTYKPSPGGSFAPLTGGQRRQSVQVHLDVLDPNNDATITLYFDRDGSGTGGEVLTQGLVPSGGAVNYTWDVSTVPTGTYYVHAVLHSPDIAVSTVTSGPVQITEVRPTAATPTFLYEDAHSISIPFDQNVGASLHASDFTLTNLTTGVIYAGPMLAVNYDSELSVATLRVPGASSFGVAGVLPSGNYRLQAAGNSIANADGETMNGNILYNFYFLNGDFDRDHDVDFLDLLTLAQNYERNAITFSGGDGNYDHRIDFNDLLIIAQQYGRTLFSALPIDKDEKDERAMLIEL